MEHAIKVEDVMTGRLVWIADATEAYMAIDFAKREGVHYLLVVDRDSDLSGVICQCDMARAGVGERVGLFAHSPVTYVMEGEHAERAAEIMRRCGVGCLPVLAEPGRVTGIITRHDLGEAGFWDWEWGVTLCASCGSRHDLVRDREGVNFCRGCLEATPGPESLRRQWYCDIGYR